MSTQAEDLHRRMAELGPFVGPDPLPVESAVGDWQPCAELLTSAAWIEQLVESTRLALSRGGTVATVDVEGRVAASTAHLGALARLISPAVALTALTQRVPRLQSHLWLRLDQHRLEVRLDYEGLVEDLERTRSHDLAGSLLRRLLLPFGDELARVTGLGRTIVLGNTSSALRGAVTVLRGASPTVGAVAEGLVSDLLTAPELSGTFTDVAHGPAGQRRWRRRSCCLFYRVPGAGLCGDCVLTRIPGR